MILKTNPHDIAKTVCSRARRDAGASEEAWRVRTQQPACMSSV
jgi:hypothetical protein